MGLGIHHHGAVVEVFYARPEGQGYLRPVVAVDITGIINSLLYDYQDLSN